MRVKIHLERINEPQLGVTLVDCPEMLLNFFPQARPQPAPPFSVLMVDDEIPPDGELFVDATKLRPVVLGQPGFALLIARSAAPALVAANADEPDEAAAPKPAAGDLEFLADAEARLKSPEMRENLRSLIEHIRAMAPRGTLRSSRIGLSGGRRYVHVPDNFVGFTIRNQAVLVHARRSGAARLSKLKIKADRQPYIRFRLKSPEDVVEAMPLIEASWRRGALGGG